jgi:hypothetical protein
LYHEQLLAVEMLTQLIFCFKFSAIIT